MLTALIISGILNVVLSLKLGFDGLALMVKEDVCSDIVKQIIQSLKNDSGWKYTPADDKNNTAHCYSNNAIGLTFSTDRDLKGGPRLYRPFYYKFSSDELLLIELAVANWGAETILSKRMDALNREVEAMLVPELVQKSKEKVIISRSKTI